MKRIVSQLDEETEEGLWLLDVLDKLEKVAVPQTRPSPVRRERLASQVGSQEFQTVDYHTFVAGRQLRHQGFKATRNSLAGTELSLVRAFLNRMISLQSASPIEDVEDEGSAFLNATDLADELADIEDLPAAVSGSSHNSQSLSREVRQPSPHKQDQKQIDKAVTQFVEHFCETSETKLITSRDLLRLHAMLRIIIAAGMPCDTSRSGGKKKVAARSAFQVLPGTGGELTWPRLLGKLLFAVFGGTSPVIERLAIESFHDQVPDDFLECWACCFWAIHARIQAAGDKPVLSTRTLQERIYRYSGLSREDRQAPGVTNVMNMLGDKFAERLGLSHEAIMKAHTSIQ